MTVFDAPDLESVDIKDVIGPERSMQVVTKKGYLVISAAVTSGR